MQKMPPPLRFIEPMECKPVEQIPEGPEWQYELKLDGYRAIAIKQDGEVALFSRNGNSFDARFPSLVDVLVKLRPKRFVLDGEIVALDVAAITLTFSNLCFSFCFSVGGERATH